MILLHRIIAGRHYRCTKSVIIYGTHYFTAGKTYVGGKDFHYPDPEHPSHCDCHCVGFIFNDFGKPHAWPYMPDVHFTCHDRWTDYFTPV